MTKLWIRMIFLPAFLLFSGWSYAMSFPAVQNLRYENNTLMWDAVVDAGGYNLYYSSGPSKHGLFSEYLTTVKNATTYSEVIPGIYQVVAFNQEETLFSEQSTAKLIWIREDGTVDNFDSDGSTVTYYGANNERYLVETRCSDGSSTCTANCNAEGNTGYVTGGFCSASEAHINASGYTDHYSCYAPTNASVITTGVYCSK